VSPVQSFIVVIKERKERSRRKRIVVYRIKSKMSTNPRKRIKNKMLKSYPEPSENQQIVRVLEMKGNNTCEVLYPDHSRGIIEIPGKFKKVVYIGKGDYLIVELFKGLLKAKSSGTIVHILQKEQIQYLKKSGQWPETLEDKPEIKPVSVMAEYEYRSSEDSEEFVNPNHIIINDDVPDDEYSF